ncbi:hypothetical protein ABMC88_05905 [Sulfitobacter sp. HNIBRBA2951]|uniref:hypothetical protein n=1 Tax=Sulfitobacter aquimarinus TaxID=3158557 RepID=UPI0032DF11ED
MKTQLLSLALMASLAACSGGNPFETEDDTTDNGGGVTDGETVGDGEGTGINRDGIPPGTQGASPNASIFRSEARVDGDGVDSGNGFATGMTYNSADDTFTVDNIAFDGDRPYDRGTAVSSLSLKANGEGRFQVYEAPTVAIDPVNEERINQLRYRAVYGVSQNSVTDSNGNTRPTTQFAIVRTGNYVDYGFGGFIYQRDTEVTLPDTLQATFRGHSAGLRDNSQGGGLQYTTADVTVDIDHDDFNDGQTILGDGVKGEITDRRVFNLDGVDITEQVANSLGEGVTEIPDVLFVIGPDVLDTNGEIVTEIQSQIVNDEGEASIYEEGTFYAIVSGEDPDEIVGVYVLESGDGFRDTSGFIVYRNDPE